MTSLLNLMLHNLWPHLYLRPIANTGRVQIKNLFTFFNLLNLKCSPVSNSTLPFLVPVTTPNVAVGVFVEALGHSVGILAFDSGEDFVEVIDFLLVVV